MLLSMQENLVAILNKNKLHDDSMLIRFGAKKRSRLSVQAFSGLLCLNDIVEMAA